MSSRSLLDPTGNDAAEREAIATPERPGSWFGDDGADGRMLSQEETDMLVRAELWRCAPLADVAGTELVGILGRPSSIRLMRPAGAAPTDRMLLATLQRGGIDSDPLVRLLAFRAWGDRDRRWFEDRGVRAGEYVDIVETAPAPVIARTWRPDAGGRHVALENGRPGELVKARIDAASLGVAVVGVVVIICRVSDRRRTAPPGWRPWDNGVITRIEILEDLLTIARERTGSGRVPSAESDLITSRVEGHSIILERRRRAEPTPPSQPSVPPWARHRGR